MRNSHRFESGNISHLVTPSLVTITHVHYYTFEPVWLKIKKKFVGLKNKKWGLSQTSVMKVKKGVFASGAGDLIPSRLRRGGVSRLFQLLSDLLEFPAQQLARLLRLGAVPPLNLQLLLKLLEAGLI